MRGEEVELTGSAGTTLAGKLQRPLGAPRAWVLLAHCFTCGKDLRPARELAAALVREGFGVLRFDFTGLGQSEGDFAQTTFASNVADLIAAARYLEEHEQPPAVLIGHSLGGTAAVAAAVQLPSIRAVATIGAPFSPGHAGDLLEPVRDVLEADGEAEIELAGRRIRVGRALLDDLQGSSIESALGALRRPLLVLHAPLDRIVGIDNARELFVAARHPKSFVSLDGADHLLSAPGDARWAGEVIATWAGRVVPSAPEVSAPPDPPPGTVQAATAASLRTEVRAGRHRLVADEPTELGGTDAGPTPYDLLLASLGACTSMTLRMYASRKGWPLQEAVVTLRHERIHSRDCEGCEEHPRRIDVIARDIRLIGALTEAQRARLLEIADRCPVHRTLHGTLEVRTSLLPGA